MEPVALFTLVSEIHHGPLVVGEAPEGGIKPAVAVVKTVIDPTSCAQPDLKKIFDELPELASIEGHTTIHFAGEVVSRFTMPAFQRTFGKEEEKIDVRWDGLTYSVNVAPGFKRFNGVWNTPGLEIVGKNGRITAKDMVSEFSGDRETISDLSMGELSFRLGSCQITGEGAKSSSLNGLKVTFSIRPASSDSANFSLLVEMEQMKLADKVYGPAVLEFQINNLDAGALSKIQSVLQETQSKLESHSQDEVNALMLPKYLEILTTLLKKSPEIEIRKLSIKTENGNLTGSLKIGIDGSSNFVLNPLALINSLTAHAEINVAEGLLRNTLELVNKNKVLEETKSAGGASGQSDEEVNATVKATIDGQLATMESERFLVKENQNYKASASYQKGTMMLNGRDIPLGNLLH